MFQVILNEKIYPVFKLCLLTDNDTQYMCGFEIGCVTIHNSPMRDDFVFEIYFYRPVTCKESF